MEKKIQKYRILIILILFSILSCYEKQDKITFSKTKIERIVILRDPIMNKHRVDSVYLRTEGVEPLSIYGAKLFWDSHYIKPVVISINNFSWSNLILIHFDHIDLFPFEDEKVVDTSIPRLKSLLKNKLHIELYDFNDKSPIDAFITDTSKVFFRTVIPSE